MIQFDSNFNGKIDQWQHKSEKDDLLKVEYDKNEDGQVDQIDLYDGHDKPLLQQWLQSPDPSVL